MWYVWQCVWRECLVCVCAVLNLYFMCVVCQCILFYNNLKGFFFVGFQIYDKIFFSMCFYCVHVSISVCVDMQNSNKNIAQKKKNKHTKNKTQLTKIGIIAHIFALLTHIQSKINKALVSIYFCFAFVCVSCDI